MDDQRAALRQRPDIETISARYEQMQTQIQDRLSAEIGGLSWVNDGERSPGGCGFEFPDVPEGESRSLSGRYTPGLPDDRWDQAVAIVWDITGRYGFRTPEIIVNRPGIHHMVVPDPYGGTMTFTRGEKNTLFRMHTGCHLPPHLLDPLGGTSRATPPNHTG